MIQSVILDLGGVVFVNGTKVFITSLGKRIGKSYESISHYFEEGLASDWRKGLISQEEFFTYLIKTLHLTIPSNELFHQWIGSYTLIPGMKELISDISVSCGVYYLSDNVKERVEVLDQTFHFLSWFNGGIFSHEVGVRKPDRRIYELLVERYNLVPSECLYVDDKEKNLHPAVALGMKTHLFTSAEILKNIILTPDEGI
jgi:HAD superfamily hydrolase (TIGR01509 family)